MLEKIFSCGDRDMGRPHEEYRNFHWEREGKKAEGGPGLRGENV